MIFVPDNEFDERLTHPNNIVHKTMHEGKGRTKGAENIDEEKRAAIGTLARAEGPTVAAAVFDCSISQASNFSKGKTIHGEGNPELKEAVNKETEHIHNIARDKLLKTLKVIDDAEIQLEKPRIQAAIAKDLATVIEKTSPRDGGGIQAKIVIYTPPQESLERFETIEVEPS